MPGFGFDLGFAHRRLPLVGPPSVRTPSSPRGYRVDGFKLVAA